MTALQQEFEYYLTHQDELVKKYEGRYIVIIGEEVIGDYDSEDKAIAISSEKHELGTFLVQKCEAGADSYTQTYHSRVVFA